MNTVHGFMEQASEELEPVAEGFLVEEGADIQGFSLASILKKRLANLLSVKSLVTLILTCVFAYKEFMGAISQDFMTVYVVVIAFYFGVQSTATNKENQR